MTDYMASLVERVPLFNGIGAEEVAVLAGVLQESWLRSGETLFREGEPGNCLYMILQGQVEVVKALDYKQERVISTRHEGEFFGEMALLDPAGLRTATVRARSAVHLLSLDRADFIRLLAARPALGFEMVRVLSLRLRQAQDSTITDLRAKNRELTEAYAELKAAHAQIIEKERLEQELRTAQRIQQSILPVELPRLPGYDFGARFVPAREVGGDLYDFIPLGRGRLGVAVGDVSDKGVPAAIFMALTRSLLRAEATRVASPRRALERVNNLLLDMNHEMMFVTLLYGILDAKQGSFAYARAGHELPLLVNADGRVAAPAHGRGTPLGLFEQVTLDEQVIALGPDDTLLLYTDGATDITDAEDTLFGIERLQAASSAAARVSTAQEFCDEIWRNLASHQGAAMQADDIALLAVRATGSG